MEHQLRAWDRLCRVSGAVLAGAGALVLAGTIGALALDVSDRVGSLAVAGSVMAALSLGGIGVFLALRRYSDATAEERWAELEAGTPLPVTLPANERIESPAAAASDLFDEDIPLWTPPAASQAEEQTLGATPDMGLEEDYWPAWNDPPATQAASASVPAAPIPVPERQTIEVWPRTALDPPHPLPSDTELARAEHLQPLPAEPVRSEPVGAPRFTADSPVPDDDPNQPGSRFSSPLLADIDVPDDVEPTAGFRSSLLSDLYGESPPEQADEEFDDQLLGEAPAPLPGGQRGRGAPHSE